MYKLVFLVVNTAAVMLPLGVSMSAYYFLSRDEEDRNATVLNILLFLTATGSFGGLVVTLFPGILTYIAGDASLESLAPSIGLLLTLWIIGSFLQIAPIANQEERLSSILIVGTSLARTAMLVGSAVIFGTIPALIVAAQIHSVLQIGVLWGYLAKRFPGFWRAFDRKMLGRQLAYALPFGVSGLLHTFQTDVHSYFVSHEFGPAVFAIYSIGCFQIPLVGMLGEAATSVLMPQINRLQALGDKERIIEISLRAGRKLAVAYLPILGFLTVMGAEFLIVLFTDTYVDSLPILRINMLMLITNLAPTDPVIRAYPQYRYWMLSLMAVMSAILVASLPWITPTYGPVGVISTVILIRFVGRIIVAVGVGRLLSFNWSHMYLFKDTGKAAVATIIAMLGTELSRVAILDQLPIVRLVTGAAVFGLIYLALLLIQRVPEKDEIAQLKRVALSPLKMLKR